MPNALDTGVLVARGELADDAGRSAFGLVPRQREARVAAGLPGADERLELQVDQLRTVGDAGVAAPASSTPRRDPSALLVLRLPIVPPNVTYWRFVGTVLQRTRSTHEPASGCYLPHPGNAAACWNQLVSSASSSSSPSKMWTYRVSELLDAIGGNGVSEEPRMKFTLMYLLIAVKAEEPALAVGGSVEGRVPADPLAHTRHRLHDQLIELARQVALPTRRGSDVGLHRSVAVALRDLRVTT